MSQNATKAPAQTTEKPAPVTVAKAAAATTATKRQGQKQTEVVTATVLRRQRLSPSFARLTVGGGGLALFDHKGYDQWFRMFLPREGAERMRLPDGVRDETFYQRYLAAPESERTWMRYVTVSGFRADATGGPELDIDVVVHGQPGDSDTGPLSTWAQTAEPGDRIAILDQGLVFRPELVGDAVLLLGDETAVPAIAGILRALPGGVRGLALLEVPDAGDFQELATPAGLEVRWLQRDTRADAPGSELLAEFGRLTLGGERPYLYAAGETAMIKALNQSLKDELEWPKDRMTTVGYWHYAKAGHA